MRYIVLQIKCKLRAWCHRSRGDVTIVFMLVERQGRLHCEICSDSLLALRAMSLSEWPSAECLSCIITLPNLIKEMMGDELLVAIRNRRQVWDGEVLRIAQKMRNLVAHD
jgi:hypothetical protein